MHAITVDAFGGPDVLEWTEQPDPQPGPGEVVIDVVAAGVNRADLLQRQGNYPPPPGASPVIGLECSGVVSALGTGVTGWSVGDEVCALLAGGGYAEKVAVPAGQLLPIPDEVSLADAAALPEVVCTVWANVFMAARLTPDEALLVHGGASGIGTMAIQLAKRHGSEVLCTAGSNAKLDRCRELGADVAISYRDEDWVARVHQATGNRGADVILDIIGGAYLEQNVQALATEGRIVVIGLQGGRKGTLDLGMLLVKRGTVHAASLRGRPVEQKAEIVAAVRENVWPAVASGQIRPVVHERYPMPEAAAAHRVLEDSSHVGKVLLLAP